MSVDGAAAATFERWVRAYVPAAWNAAVDAGDVAALEAVARGTVADEVLRAAAAEGWLTPEWPTQYGGRGLDATEASDVKVLLRRWHVGDVRTAIGTAWVGPTILQWGSDDQRSAWLPPIARAEELWCQLFSEPDAGSDLAAVRTTAVRDGDTWLVTGAKMWTSRADVSRRGLLLARTDPGVPKHDGLTAFGLDMTLPGVDINPIQQMTGDAEFFEVVLADVRVDDPARIGAPGQGWDVCRTALGFERLAGSGVGAAPPGSVVGRGIGDLINRHRGADAATRARLVDEWIQAEVITMSNRRVAARCAAGLSVGPEGSVTKVLQAEHTKRLQRLFVDLEGAGGVAWDRGDEWAGPNAWAFLRVQAKTIAGGTSEVLRNQIAERVLGLPRDQDPTRGLPWSAALSVERGR